MLYQPPPSPSLFYSLSFVIFLFPSIPSPAETETSRIQTTWKFPETHDPFPLPFWTWPRLQKLLQTSSIPAEQTHLTHLVCLLQHDISLERALAFPCGSVPRGCSCVVLAPFLSLCVSWLLFVSFARKRHTDSCPLMAGVLLVRIL